MDILGALFGKGKGQPPAKFHYADNMVVTARDFGYYSGNEAVLQPSIALFEAVFKDDAPGQHLPIAPVATRLPGVPHLYFLAFHTAIYTIYVREILRADDATMAEVQAGIDKAMGDIRMPDGAPLDDAARRSLHSAGAKLAAAIVEDMNEALAQTAEKPKQFPSRATKLLLGLVEKSFHQGQPNPPPLLSGIGNAHAARLQMLDDAPANLLHFLGAERKVRLVRERLVPGT